MTSRAHSDAPISGHHVQFYEDERFLIDSLSEYVAAGLRNGEGVVVVATAEHLTALSESLPRAAIDPELHRTRGQLIILDAREAMSRFMLRGRPDATLFSETVGALLDEQHKRFAQLRVFGEIVDVLSSQQERAAVLELEWLWNKYLEGKYHRGKYLRGKYLRGNSTMLLCGYQLGRFSSVEDASDFRGICEAHSDVLPSETWSNEQDAEQQRRSVASLQQKAFALQTEVIRLQKQQAKLLRQHEEAALRHSEEMFAHVASHDLQEPLRIISTYLQLIQRRNPEAFVGESMRHFQYVTTAAERMRNLINALLDYSLLIRREHRIETFTAKDAIKDAIDNLRSKIATNSAKIHVGEMPVISSDRVAVTHLFQNLIGNAVKFRGENSPEVRIESREEPSAWVFSIGDNGIGIPSEEHDKLFTLFHRLHSRDEYPGSGIGLAACKRLAGYLGGSIWFDSVPTVGSTFSFRIPRQRV